MTSDWALSAVPEEVGVDLYREHLRYLAFADDVVLLVSSPVGLRSVQEIISRVQEGFTFWAEGPSLLLAMLVTWLERLQSCPVKPQQKMGMLMQGLLPQLMYLTLYSEVESLLWKR